MTSGCQCVFKVRQGWLRVFSLLFGLAGASGFVLPRASFATAVDPVLRIRVNNYSLASQATLARAEREAERILRNAGLRALWLDCPAEGIAKMPDDACDGPLEAGDVVLRVIAEPNGKILPDNVFGFAVAPILATVYYEPARRRAQGDNAEFEAPTILGCAIAHEVGHLLLGGGGHSDVGIMQPKWERGQVGQALRGYLSFTSQQAEKMRAALQQRTERANADTSASNQRRSASPLPYPSPDESPLRRTGN